jgi:hypothetical protein
MVTCFDAFFVIFRLFVFMLKLFQLERFINTIIFVVVLFLYVLGLYCQLGLVLYYDCITICIFLSLAFK